MIRLVRPLPAPAALDTPAIRAYVAACAARVLDPALPKPEPPEAYRTSDLLAAFDTFFHAKCYLTEEKFESAWAMDVDHFEPANENPARVYDWANLFPATHKANMMRPRKLPLGGLLDPCSAADDVENDIIYTLEVMGEEPGFKARDAANQRAVNTAHLLDLLHNGRPNDAASHKNTAELRRQIERKYKLVKDAWEHYRDALDDNNPHDQARAETTLRALLSRRASFTMLMRSLPFVRKRVPAYLLD